MHKSLRPQESKTVREREKQQLSTDAALSMVETKSVSSVTNIGGVKTADQTSVKTGLTVSRATIGQKQPIVYISQEFKLSRNTNLRAQSSYTHHKQNPLTQSTANVQTRANILSLNATSGQALNQKQVPLSSRDYENEVADRLMQNEKQRPQTTKRLRSQNKSM